LFALIVPTPPATDKRALPLAYWTMTFCPVRADLMIALLELP
jgi:hypothetical protein